ncbi:hypothetical protein LF41_1189 [Lysobacter dokdonensis DS-58]|uniref:EF-hand domain-containing protein n=2 Tax=Noviluteimonas TaxID=3382693 RepID=A0A0A2WKE6_9GAMM|nr:hypothetical protein LF41_1189 [Lysobacter dokdonensis DS-58]
MFAALIIATGDCLAGNPSQTSATLPVKQQRADDFTQYDTDGNGLLSKPELAKHPMGAHASMVDANRDGVLDKREFAELERM